MGKVVISRLAITDLEAIWNYTKTTWSEQQANEYYGRIRACMERLCDLPTFLETDYGFVRPGVLGFHIGHHVVLYGKAPDGSIFVSRILHERMDFFRHLD